MTNNIEKEPASKFELSREVSSHYFKSSFARSMFSNSNQSKSLDFVYFDNSTIDEENENETKTPTDDFSISSTKSNGLFTSPLKRGYSTKVYDHKFEQEFHKSNSGRNQNNNAISFWKRKQQEVALFKPVDLDCSQGDDVAAPRKDCHRLVEENHQLLQTMDHSHLQTQVDTLQWQLKQAESSRQMYRAVLEQVSKFLERVHRNLDQVNGKPPPSKCKARSRSVHTVASCPSQSRPVSPSPSTLPLESSVQRANSISQIQDSHTYSMFRDISWRSPRGVVEEVTPDKLSQEAFRLLRTVQSLLGTREPDLATRLTPTPTPAPTPDHSRDSTWCVGSCSSLSCSSQRKSLDASSCSSRAEVEDGGDAGTPQLSVGSTEDESGFSSMSSFHEVGLPEVRTYPEVGLPIVEPTHRRWSSTPVDDQSFRSNSSIRVLWV